MARKNTSNRKPTDESDIAVEDVPNDQGEAAESEPTATATSKARTPASKPGKAKAADDPATGSVGLERS